MSNDKPFAIELAKSARSLCRHCKQKIQPKEIRIAKLLTNPFSSDPVGGEKMRHWHHVSCLMTVFHKQRATTKRISDPNIDINGWDEMSEADQKIVTDALKEFEETEKTAKGTKAQKSSAKPKAEKKAAKAKPSKAMRAKSKAALSEEESDSFVEHSSSEGEENGIEKESKLNRKEKILVPIEEETETKPTKERLAKRQRNRVISSNDEEEVKKEESKSESEMQMNTSSDSVNNKKPKKNASVPVPKTAKQSAPKIANISKSDVEEEEESEKEIKEMVEPTKVMRKRNHKATVEASSPEEKLVEPAITKTKVARTTKAAAAAAAKAAEAATTSEVVMAEESEAIADPVEDTRADVIEKSTKTNAAKAKKAKTDTVGTSKKVAERKPPARQAKKKNLMDMEIDVEKEQQNGDQNGTDDSSDIDEAHKIVEKPVKKTAKPHMKSKKKATAATSDNADGDSKPQPENGAVVAATGRVTRNRGRGTK